MLDVYLRTRHWLDSEEGQDLIEYALLVVFIALAVLLILPNLGTTLSGVFDTIRTKIASAS
jgi:Flp pilus assembly pilin Flp